MLKVLLDPQIFNVQNFGGISRYYTEILSALADEKSVSMTLPLLYTDNLHYKRSSLFNTSYQNENRFLIRYSKAFRSYQPRKLREKNSQNLVTLLKERLFDLFVPSYYDPYFLEYIGDKPFVLTVHDMINELFPHYFTEDKTTVPNKKLLMERAAKIIAVSENTRKDIIKLYPDIDASKIKVIHLAHGLAPDQRTHVILPENYILFVGNRKLYKNFIFLLKSVKSLLNNTPGLQLLCAGGGDFDSDELQLIGELGLYEKVKQQNFEDPELPAYYKHAQCFVFPTEYEGFGIPVLEAMACGCPVVLGKHSSFPEVAGDAGIYFDLNSPQDLSSKIKYLLENEDTRREYKIKGLERSKLFSWEKNAHETLEVYKSVIKEDSVL
ncbi:glycosyltransferase family 4 protein [Pedobacter hartonius]|uniref:Glycosyltransferase involved in cell wall bisynthesis n=1 Tax=Pedobacter hartonius TaxID=425514 RepID=A0A1H3ZQ49_9SPHI|nr:glycosyltransferase family 1 protein [Pedobacter hartonius]SEA25808.1 Glycosyltransferase involved in cell wall bisynthesis [Pedobacter hartonius]